MEIYQVLHKKKEGAGKEGMVFAAVQKARKETEQLA